VKISARICDAVVTTQRQIIEFLDHEHPDQIGDSDEDRFASLAGQAALEFREDSGTAAANGLELAEIENEIGLTAHQAFLGEFLQTRPI
jgi:hypothetical protein